MKRCPHGVYIPDRDEIALYCSICNPAGVPEGETPVFNRRGSLDPVERGKLPLCPDCGVPVPVSSGLKCLICGHQVSGLGVPLHGVRAHARQDSSCPECGSGVHYGKGRRWECADCGAIYDPLKRKKKERVAK